MIVVYDSVNGCSDCVLRQLCHHCAKIDDKCIFVEWYFYPFVETAVIDLKSSNIELKQQCDQAIVDVRTSRYVLVLVVQRRLVQQAVRPHCSLHVLREPVLLSIERQCNQLQYLQRDSPSFFLLVVHDIHECRHGWHYRVLVEQLFLL